MSTLVLPSEGEATLQQAAEARVALLQPVFVNGRFIDARLYPAAEQDVLLGLQDARLSLISAENQTVIAVFRALLALGTAADEHELATRGLERAEAEVRRAELRFEQGSIRFDELLDAEISRDERADEVFSTEVALRAANTELSLLTGSVPTESALEPGEHRVPREDLERLATELRTAQEATAADSIDLQRQRAALERAQLARVLGGAADSGQLQAFLTVRPQYEVGRAPDADFTASFTDLYGSSRRPVVAAGISLSVPVFDGGAARLRQEQRLLQETAAARAVEQTTADLELRRSEVTAERDAAFRRFERASEQIRAAQARV
ncbi:MAG: TolC family protein, partial [Spirochaetaceae bacterium]